MPKYEVGKIVDGTVTGIESYGAFVSFDEFYSGLIHISEISHGYVNEITDFINIGDTIKTKIIGIDEENSHLKLSIKEMSYKNNKKRVKAKIKETEKGFSTLEAKLPIWIKEALIVKN